VTVQRFDWPDLGYTGLATTHSHHVSWRIIEIVMFDPETKAPIGWWPEGAIGAFPEATDPADGESMVEIGVKWDGCANYSWADDCATHTCGLKGVQSLAGVLLRVFEVTAKILPTWNSEVAGETT
jgi:hypothetical protein